MAIDFDIEGSAGLLLLVLTLGLGACTTEGPSSAASDERPRVTGYHCGEDGSIRIEQRGDIVRVFEPPPPPDPDATEPAAAPAPVELAAAPPGQRSRYGMDGYALVVEGREALWMKAGRAPMTCRG